MAWHGQVFACDEKHETVRISKLAIKDGATIGYTCNSNEYCLKKFTALLATPYKGFFNCLQSSPAHIYQAISWHCCRARN